MDPDPYSNNSFIEVNRIEPFISFKNENSIKTFNTIFLNDESETIVFSEANFTENYDFLQGQIKALSLRPEEYMVIKKAIKEGLDIRELVNYKPEYATITNLFITDKKSTLIADENEIPYHKVIINDIILEDLKPTNKIDRINNYLMRYNKKLSTSVFREIEAEELRKNIRVIESSKQKIKTA